MNNALLPIHWDTPAGVRVASSTRLGGISLAPFDSLNLAQHVGDCPQDVEKNRSLFSDYAHLPAQPIWLNQVHGNEVIRLTDKHALLPPQGDAAITNEAHTVCAIMTADCVPILICDKKGTEVAAIHAGWKGLANGIIQNTINAFDDKNLTAWIGPCIGPSAYRIDTKVYEKLAKCHIDAAKAFTQVSNKQWLANLPYLARLQLCACGVDAITHSGYCTFERPEQFFSYRREGQTGRMVHCIWLTESA